MVNPRAASTIKNVYFPQQSDMPPVEWSIFDGLASYEATVAAMEKRAADIAAGIAPECVWLLEHPSLYTAGTSANQADLVDQDSFPVFKTGRGGQYTYHGPGQRVAYVLLNLQKRQPDVRLYVSALEQWLINTLEQFNITGERREERVGVWVQRPEKPRTANGSVAEDKIAALGIRLRKWVSFHGVSINVAPDLKHFEGIIACGIEDHGITSFEDLGLLVSQPEVDIALRASFEEIFGPTIDATPIQTP
ncbi:MAG: lipoyl(octanoyl) transferase LipB [Hyphomicrobiales bacterium]